MRRSGRLLIIVGVVMGLAAVLLAVFALSGGDDDDDATTTDSGPDSQEITIVQAKRAVQAHVKLTADDLEEVVVLDDELVNPDDHPRRINEVIGFAYIDELVEGQQILRSRLEVSGIAEELEPGRRAISLQVDTNNLVAGLIRQDDSIDIVYEVNAELLRVTPTTPLEIPDELTLNLDQVTIPPFGEAPDPAPYPYPGEPGSRFAITEANGGNPIAKTVLQDIRVLRVITSASSTTSQSSQTTSDASYLVIEVSPDQAELVHMMTTVGTYQILLRGTDDEEIVTTIGANMELLVTEYQLPVPKTVRLPEAGAQ